MKRSRARRLRVLGTALAACATGLAVAAVLFAAWLPTPGGRAWAADRLEEAVSSRIPGSLEVGAIDTLAWEGVRGRDIVFRDEEGEPIIEAHRVELAVDWGALARGRFHSERAVGIGGRVYLTTDAQGRLRIDRAFEGEESGEEPTGRDTVRLESFVVSDVRVVARFEGAPEAVVSGAGAVLDVRAPEHAAVTIDAERLRGHARIDAPAPIELSFSGGTLLFDGNAAQRAVLDLPSRMNEHDLGVHALVREPEGEPLRVEVTLTPHGVGGLFASLPAIVQSLVAEIGADALDVTVDTGSI